MNNSQQWEPDRGSWLEKVAYLDAALTRKPWADVCHTARNYQTGGGTVEDFTLNSHSGGRMYYLSDGGYSRLFWDEEGGCLRLASESRQEVKSAWVMCPELIADIEDETATAE